MAGIWTPIPQSWADRARRFRSASLGMVLWRLLLIVLGLLVLAIGLSSSSMFVGLLIGIGASIVLSDDIRATISDLWNRNFWVWRT